MTEKIKNLVSKSALDYILTRDESILEKAEKKYAKPYRSEEDYIEILHEFGAILFYETFESALKKKDRKYFNYLKQEIEEKKENAEVDIDYLEEIMPFMKSLNFMMGIYNKQYSPDEKEILQFGALVRTGRDEPSIIQEEIIIIPYNLRMNKKELNSSTS